jgi:hypothetical protein
MTPILVCTVTGRSLPVLEASVKAYCPDVELIVNHVERSTFGQSYNMALDEAFKKYDEVIIANDDIVLTPNSYSLLLEDVELLKKVKDLKVGMVGARSDCVREPQNIKFNIPEDKFTTLCVSPLFAWMHKSIFELTRFPHTNWFSDDMLCMDLNIAGYTNWVSRSYVHHAGSQTVGNDDWGMYFEAIDWIEKNRPEILHRFKR